jgi:polyhydroxybutyrate depolymerase
MRLLVLLLLLVPALARADALSRVDMADVRYYLIALPEGVPNPPLIIALHGGGGAPDQFARTSSLTAPALAAGFAVAYPAGNAGRRGRYTWNSLYCCGYAARARVDDVAFIAAVIDDAARRFGTEDRASLTGMSNGAMMAQTVAALRPDRVAALATVAGTMDTRRLSVPRAIPFLHIHGTADDMVPFAGGEGDNSITRTDFASVDSVVTAFLRPYGQLPLTRSTIDPAPEDGTRVLRSAWGEPARPQVVLLAVENGAHVWSGSRRARGQGTTQDISAIEEVIRFFAAWR